MSRETVPEPNPGPGSPIARTPGRRSGKAGAALAALSVALVLAMLGTLLAGPALYRAGVLDIDAATWGVASVAWPLALLAVAVSAVALGWSAVGKRSRGVIVAIVTMTTALLVGFRIYSYRLQHEALPPIHDVQTDWSRPVAFTTKTLQVREQSGAAPVRDDAIIQAGAGRWAGMSFSRAQAEAFDLKPLLVGAPPAEATVAVAEAAERLGWLVMLNDPPGGQIEAVTRSAWYGLATDAAVRVAPQGQGSRIDVRATSRTRGSDMGANARRIKLLLDDVAFALRGSGEREPPAAKDGGAE
ncbi:MAG: DUF1499 domain-containing protein [Alphaproteobacteria bacterium]|nr:DUF1499 domain-containing protein [Alphaproteobacteria bacterium]